MKTVNWGILGCGQIANSFVKALQHVNNAVLYATGARNDLRSKSFAAKWGFKKSYGSYKELVNDENIDIIYIATPHSYHFAHTKLCLNAGKNVLCEKPFTINHLQLKELISLANKRNLFMMEALWTLAFPGTIRVKKLIDSNIIGDIVSMEADFGYRFPLDPSHRIYDPLLAGGALLDIGIYPLFLSLYLFGYPQKVIAHSILNNDNIDIASSVITRYNNEIICHLNSNIKANTPIKASIYGTKGRIEFGDRWFTPSDITVKLDKGKTETFTFSPIANGYEYEAIEATNAILAGEKESNLIPLSFSLQLIKLLDTIRKQTGIIYPQEIESIDYPYGWNKL